MQTKIACALQAQSTGCREGIGGKRDSGDQVPIFNPDAGIADFWKRPKVTLGDTRIGMQERHISIIGSQPDFLQF